MNTQKRTQLTLGLIGLIILSSLAAITQMPAIPQSHDYHLFVDDRPMHCIHNFWNVISNLPFLIIGLIGLARLRHQNSSFPAASIILFTSIALVAFGSSYYHLMPSHQTLLWDRLPIALAFMSLFCMAIHDYASQPWGKRLLLPLLLAGGSAVLHWYYSELRGAGDLRIYILVQLLPILIIPCLLLGLNPDKRETKQYWTVLCFYLLAKACEYYDGEIFEFTRMISGHSLKHIMAAWGLYYLLPPRTK